MSVSIALAFASLVAFAAQIYKGGDAGVQPPAVVSDPTPFYSPSAMHEGIEGTVFLQTLVDTRGRPQKIAITKSLERSLDQNAIAALRKWRFTPATKDGKPVDYLLQVSMTFDRRGGRRGPVHECGKGDLTNPTVVKDVKPQFTGRALLDRDKRLIELEAIVEADGTVTAVRILKPAYPEVNISAINALLQWQFKPGMRAGVPVACRVHVEFSFHVR